jgi:hypothetical protein
MNALPDLFNLKGTRGTTAYLKSSGHDSASQKTIEAVMPIHEFFLAAFRGSFSDWERQTRWDAKTLQNQG